MEWETFKYTGSRRGNLLDAKVITLTKYGQAHFSKACMEMLGDYKVVLLKTNGEKNQIGFQPINTDHADFMFAKKISRGLENRYGSCSIISLTKQLGLKIESPTRFKAVWDNEEKMLVIDLKKSF